MAWFRMLELLNREGAGPRVARSDNKSLLKQKQANQAGGGRETSSTKSFIDPSVH